MPACATQSKPERLVGEGKVRELSGARVFFIDGDHGFYLVTTLDSRAVCTCPAVGTCSHIAAVELAITRPHEAAA